MIVPVIKIVADEATPAMREWVEQLTPERFAGRVGPALQTMTMEHLAALGPNEKGYPSTRFYEKFARNVRWIPMPNGVTIAILPAIVSGRQVGLALRVFGGTIVPQTVDMLSIPISPVSYGHVPSDFPNLFLVRTVRGAYLVQRGEQVSEATGRMIGAGRGQGGNIGRRLRADLIFLFKLAPSVTQTGDRDVLPADDEYIARAIEAAKGGVN